MISSFRYFTLIALALLSIASCTRSSSSTANTVVSGTSTKEQALSAADADKAQANYVNYCGGCHGRALETFVNRKWQHGTSPEALFKSIKHGYPDQGMPAYDTTFTDQEINQLVSYIRTGIKNGGNPKQAQSSGTVYRSEEFSFRLDTVVTGLNVPWAMAFLPNGDMFITERGGTLYRFTQDRQLQKVEGTPEVLAEGQGGLLDVKLHPDFAKNNTLFLSYSAVKREGGQTLSTTAIMRAKLTGNALQDQKVIFEAQPYERTRHHYGSRLEFGLDGY
ncbi:MAG: PQQ-dependent sugar dehydrogenase, partial [Rufibacter sp.]